MSSLMSSALAILTSPRKCILCIVCTECTAASSDRRWRLSAEHAAFGEGRIPAKPPAKLCESDGDSASAASRISDPADSGATSVRAADYRFAPHRTSIQLLLRNHLGESVVEPFLRWAGGKRLLLPQILGHFPELDEETTYFEPFLGGGAVFFAMRPPQAVLSDTTAELIEAYRGVRECLTEVINHLEGMEFSSENYYAIRASRPETLAERTARFIFLNKTCFNGLYRVNLRGEFNVPVGDQKPNQLTCDVAQLAAASYALRDARISSSDFEDTLSQCKSGDVVYCDPPYTIAHSNNGFIEYNAQVFSWDDQRRLARVAAALRDRGVHVFVSNADHESIRDLYVSEFDFEAIMIDRWSTMAGSAVKRFASQELLLRGRP